MSRSPMPFARGMVKIPAELAGDLGSVPDTPTDRLMWRQPWKDTGWTRRSDGLAVETGRNGCAI